MNTGRIKQNAMRIFEHFKLMVLKFGADIFGKTRAYQQQLILMLNGRWYSFWCKR
jgi:hypothetical protein